MKEFMLLIRGGEYPEKGTGEHAAHMQEWMDWMKKLTDDGNLKGGQPFTTEGKLVTADNVNDGVVEPSVGGYMHITADSVEHAVKISQGCPALGVGGDVEVRECMMM